MRHRRANSSEFVQRQKGILAFLAMGEASAQQICEGTGYSWPAELEKIRGTLSALVKAGKITKAIRPNHQTRIAYYSVTE